MRAGRRSLSLQYAVAVIAVSLSAVFACAASQDVQNNKKAVALLDSCPALFVEDSGDFVHRGKGANILLSEDGVTFQLFDKSGSEIATDSFRVTFPGSRTVRPEGLGKSDAQFNYYTGNNPAQWRTGLPTFEKVIYRGLYPGIDLVVHGLLSHVKYEFIVSPGADYSVISVAYHDILGLSLGDNGGLYVQTALGELVEDAPYVYQNVDGVKREVACQYRLSDDSRYTFSITGDYDRNAALIIDPNLAWSTFLGGSGKDVGYGMATDGSGNVFVTGETYSSDLPTPNGWDTSRNGSIDAFVAKFDSAGALLWSTFLGGTAIDRGRDVATDQAGNAFVTGNTYSTDFPTSNGWDTGYNGGQCDAFVAKFDPSGMLLWSTFLGGRTSDYGEGIATDGTASVFVTGYTYSPDFPTPNGWDTSLNVWTWDAFVAKFDSSGTLLWSTFLGGSDADAGYGIATDGAGNVLVTGLTASSDFPTANGWDTSLNDVGDDCYDAFVAKLDPSGTLLWSTFLGGNVRDRGDGIATDGAGNVLVTGSTISSDFPTPNGWDTSFSGAGDDYTEAFVAKFSSGGMLLWSTFLGGDCHDEGHGIATDISGNVFVTGETWSSDFPTPNGWDTSSNGSYDAFVAKFGSDGALLWSTFLGGYDEDYAYGIATDGRGNVFVTGETQSSSFPTPNGWDTSLNDGSDDAFVAKFTEPMYSLTVHSTPVRGIGITGTPSGTTDYSTNLSKGTLINLTAPAMVAPNYAFDRWTVNGVVQTVSQTTVSFNINGNRTAVALYQVIQETVFPVVPTTCPPVAATLCPEISTACPPAATVCPPAGTQCPPASTLCPSIGTQCPPVVTECSLAETTCPPVDTECPAVATACPAVATHCPSCSYVPLMFGMKNGATNLFDIGIDALASPTTPDGDTAYFSSIQDESIPMDKLWHDYRAPATDGYSTNWRLYVYVSAGKTMTISWDQASLPADKTCTIYAADPDWNPLDEGSDMKADLSSVSVTYLIGTARYLIAVTGEPAAEWSVNLTADLVKWPALTVQSVPMTGVAITGTTGMTGTTNYKKYVNPTTVPKTVTLTAPATGPAGSGSLPFLRWAVDDVSQEDYVRTVTLSISDDTTAMAYYGQGSVTVFPVIPTACPLVVTSCPPVTTACPPAGTSCPPAVTSCPPATTTCPPVTTQCPTQATSCPTVSTSCPPSTTHCPPASTSCPPSATVCPASVTACPPSETSCPLVDTQCPAMATSCPIVSTQCPETQTACPVDTTICPEAATSCPPVKLTVCPLSSTACPVVDTACPPQATACPMVSTECPPSQTACPVITTECPEATTSCPPVKMTVCPLSSTACPVVDTVCPAEATSCPPSATTCPAADTQCPPVETACPAQPTVCPPQTGTLYVQSTPLSGVSITGTHGGTTDYLTDIPAGRPVSLTAPATAAPGGTDMVFSQWLINGVPQAGHTVEFTMPAGTGGTGGWPWALDYAVFWANRPPSATPLHLTSNSLITGSIFGFGSIVVDENASVTGGLVYATGTVTGTGSYMRGVIPDPLPDAPVFDHSPYNTMITHAGTMPAGNWYIEQHDYHLNGATIYVNGSVSLHHYCTIYGPGTIVSTGSITFESGTKAYDSVNMISGGLIKLGDYNTCLGDGNVIYGRTGVNVTNNTSVAKSFIFSPGTVQIYNNDTFEGIVWAGTARVENNARVKGAIVADQYYGSIIANNFQLIYDSSLLSHVPPPEILHADVTAVAEYTIVQRTLNVQSSPITGVAIKGAPAGTTNYSSSLNDNSVVSLTAPDPVDRDGRHYAFLKWTIGSTDFSTASVVFNINEDTTCVAEYAETTPPESLAWATFLGGSGEDEGHGVAIDGEGNVYVTGFTNSSDFPTLGGWDTSRSGTDAFVAKFNSGGALLWSTFLGGTNRDRGLGIATDGEGNVFITGDTRSSDFPTPNGWDTSYNGFYDAFVAKFDSAGTLLWSTFLGGASGDYGYGIATDGEGNVLVTGLTSSSDFPTPNGWDTSFNGNGDAFVAKFDSAGALLWSTFLGGNDTDSGYGIATDGEGNAFVTGETFSSNFPTPNGWDRSFNGGWDAFVAKFDPSGALLWSTYLGGSGGAGDSGGGIATDREGNVLLTGSCASPGFPTPNGWDTTFNGENWDGFVAKFGPSGTLLWSTYLGGAGIDHGGRIATDGAGNAFVTGSTGGSGFPTLNGWDTSYNGGADGFITKFDPTGALLWSTFLGGAKHEGGQGIATDGRGNIFVTDLTSSPDFPTPNGWDTSFNGYYDAFVAKFIEPTYYALTVQSTPLTGISITGTDSGITEYSKHLSEGTLVSLTAPTVTGYIFQRWTVADVPQPDGQIAISFNINGDTTAVASYREIQATVFPDVPTACPPVDTVCPPVETACPEQPTVCPPPTATLNVRSNPIVGVAISGTHSGTTNYSWTGITLGTHVKLTAPKFQTIRHKTYKLYRWTLDGVAKRKNRLSVEFDMNTTPRTAVAAYKRLR